MQTVPIAAVYSLAGALIGALIGHLLTRSREHAVWVRDNRIKEWQQLLASMTSAYMAQLSKPMDITGQAVQENYKKKDDALADFDIVLATRIFIADDASDLDVTLKWSDCIDGFRQEDDKQGFKDAFQRLRISIVEKAKLTK